MNPFLLTLIIAATVGMVFFVGVFICYKMAFYNNPKKNPSDPYRHVKNDGSEASEFPKSLIDNILSVPYENIYVTSHDGLKLRARLYLKDKNAPFALQFHGYKSTPMLDFSGGGALAMELGFNVIMPDQRACGESEGRTISFGYNEHKDVYTWIRYVRENFNEDAKILLFGVSLGAGTVIMSAGNGVAENVKGVIADCPFSSAKEIITKVIYDMKLPGKLLYPFVRIGAKIFGRFDPNAAEPYQSIKTTKTPVLIVHGEDDKFVPLSMSEKINAGTPLTTLHTFPKAKHGTSFIVDSDRYSKITKEFILKCLDEQTAQNDNNCFHT